MKPQICGMLSALFLMSTSASGQCAKPAMNPVWDTGKQQFICVAPEGHTVIASDDYTVSPKGDKEFCGTARDNLIKACPSSDDGKACKSKAKSIFNSCYKDSKAQGSSATTNRGSSDPAICMQTYIQQQQACQARKLPPPAPGQPYVPDTCLQDAQAAQNKCIANSR